MNLSFSIYMPELVAVGSPMKVFQKNSGPVTDYSHSLFNKYSFICMIKTMLLSRKQVFPSSAKDQKLLTSLMNVHHSHHCSRSYFQPPIRGWRCDCLLLLSGVCPVPDDTSAANS